MASSQQPSVASRDRIRACLDLGSGNLKGHVQHVPGGVSPCDQEIVELKFAEFGDSTAVELRVKYRDDDHKLLLGDELSTWLRRNRDQSGGILEQFKLALCPQYRESIIVRRVFNARGLPIGDLPEIQNVYADLLKLCQTWIRDCMRTQYGDDGFAPGYWDQISIELQLTVPVMWDGMARGVMRNAAKDAGFDNVVLRSEPECAAFRYVYEGWKAGRIWAEQVYTFLDIGRGTGDASTVTVENSEVDGGPPRITVLHSHTQSLRHDGWRCKEQIHLWEPTEASCSSRHSSTTALQTFSPDDHPVSYGALQTYLESPDEKFPRRITLYVARGGTWEGKARPKSHGAEQTVHSDDRLVPIFVKQLKGRPQCKTEGVEFIVDAEHRFRARLKIPIFSSDRNDESGSPPYDDDGKLRPGLVEWPLVFRDLPDLESLGYRQQQTTTGYQHYAIETRVSAVKKGDHLEVQLQVLVPDQTWPTQSTQRNPPPAQVMYESSQEIWASNRSHALSHAGENRTVFPRKRTAETTPGPQPKSARTEPPATAGPSTYNLRGRFVPQTSGTRSQQSMR